jgi:hypothetical protein
MAKKGGKSKGKISQGLRPTVSRRLRNALRKDRRSTFSVESFFQRERSISANRDKRLAEKYASEERTLHTATDLFARYNSVATWAACVQAAKTEWVSQFHVKYGALLKA